MEEKKDAKNYSRKELKDVTSRRMSIMTHNSSYHYFITIIISCRWLPWKKITHVKQWRTQLFGFSFNLIDNDDNDI